MAHLFDVGIHVGPVVLQAEMVQGAICIQVTADRVGVEHDEEDIVQFVQDNLQMYIKRAAMNRFLEYKHIVFDHNM